MDEFCKMPAEIKTTNLKEYKDLIETIAKIKKRQLSFKISTGIFCCFTNLNKTRKLASIMI